MNEPREYQACDTIGDDDDEVQLVAVKKRYHSFLPRVVEIKGNPIDGSVEDDPDDEDSVIRFVTTNRIDTKCPSPMPLIDVESLKIVEEIAADFLPEHEASQLWEQINSQVRCDFPRIVRPICRSASRSNGSNSLQTNDRHKHAEQIRVVNLKCLFADCPLTFLTEDLMFQHMCDKHGRMSRWCPIQGCAASFDEADLLTEHLQNVHADVTELKCGQCTDQERTFSRHGQLIFHIFHNHHEGTFACTKTDCVFTGKVRNDVRIHCEQVHHRYGCQYCRKEFSYKHVLLQHEWRHLGIKPYMCKLCQFDSPDRSTVLNHVRKRHLKEHKSTPSMQREGAQIKNMQSKDPNTYIEHRNLSSLEEKASNEIMKVDKKRTEHHHRCQFCPKVFSHKHVLLRHQLGHMHIKPYRCKLCQYASNDRSVVVKHIRSRHLNVPRVKNVQHAMNIVENNANDFLEVLPFGMDRTL